MVFKIIPCYLVSNVNHYPYKAKKYVINDCRIFVYETQYLMAKIIQSMNSKLRVVV